MEKDKVRYLAGCTKHKDFSAIIKQMEEPSPPTDLIPEDNNLSSQSDSQISSSQTTETTNTTNSKKKLIILACIVVVMIGCASAWFITHKNKPETKKQSVPNIAADQNIFQSPRFNSVKSFAHYNNADWYAVDGGVIRIDDNGTPAFYTQKQGVPYGIPQTLVVYGDNLWLATGDGIAMLKTDHSGFESSSFKAPSDISNGELFYDSFGNNLYLSTFKNFYKFNDSTKTWQAVAGSGSSAPINMTGSASNKNFAVVSGAGPGNLLWVFNRKANNWSKSFPALEDQGQNVFSLNGELFVAGRSAGYQSCDSADKIAATSIFHLSSDGKWQPLNSFNTDKSRSELTVQKQIKGSGVSFVSSPCGDTKPIRYSASYDGTTIQLKNEGQASGDYTAWTDDKEQTELVAELISKTKLHPATSIRAVDSDGNVIFTASDRIDFSSSTWNDSLYIANGAKLQDSKKIDIPSNSGSVIKPILCTQGNKRSLSYVFIGAQQDSEGGPTGVWDSAKIYKINGTKATELISLGNNVASPNFGCSGNKLTWLGTSSVQALNTDTKKVTSIGSALGTNLAIDIGQVYPLDNGDLWVLIGTYDLKSSSPTPLYYVDAQKLTVKKLATVNGGTLKGGSSSYAWLSLSNDNYPNTVLRAYDKQGKQVLSKDTKLPTETVAISNESSVVFESTNQDVFTPYTVTEYSVTGQDTKLDLKDVAVRQLYSSGSFSSLGQSFGIFDSIHKVIWVSDDEFGVFTIPLL